MWHHEDLQLLLPELVAGHLGAIPPPLRHTGYFNEGAKQFRVQCLGFFGFSFKIVLTLKQVYVPQ